MEDPTTSAIHTFAANFCVNRLKYRNFAQRFIHNKDAADELVNDCFVRLWEKRLDLADVNIEAYFYSSLKHASLNWLRNKQNQFKIHNEIYDKSYRLLQYDITSLDAFDPNLIFRNEVRDIMLRQLDKMPGLTRRIFLDNRFNNLSCDEIAGKYGISIFKVKRELHTAMCRLRTALQDYLPPILTVLLIALTWH